MALHRGMNDMQPCNFPGAITIGKPKDWIDELDGPCAAIYVALSVDDVTGMNEFHSVYKPTPDELAALCAGGVFRLTICGLKAHPVFKLNVLGPKLVASIGLEPMVDLGGVIEKP
jgi:hypothetical protein